MVSKQCLRQVVLFGEKDVSVFVPVLVCIVIMFIFQIKRIIKVKNGLTTLVCYFFLKMPKTCRLDDTKWRK